MSIWTEPVESSIAIDLDQGDSACIHLALTQPGSLLLMDERGGRAVAKQYGITMAGTAAILGQARMRNLTPSARDAFERLL